MSIEDAERAASAIDGYVSVSEGRLLYELARRAEGSIVEVGSWKGRSTIWLAYGSRDGHGGTVFAIDPHAGSKDHAEKGESSTLGEFWANIRAAGLEDIVIPMVMSSEDAHREIICPVGLLFLDGPSEGELVREEVQRWRSCLGPGAVLAIHDTVSMPGPRDAAESLYLSSRFVDVRLVDTITYATVASEASVRHKLSDIQRLATKRADILLGRINYPAPVRRMGRRVLNSLSK